MSGVRRRRMFGAVAVVVVAGASFVGCGVLREEGPARVDAAGAAGVVGAAGWTRLATTKQYLLVVNVLPGEEMFSVAAMEREHPIIGEEIIAGVGNALGLNARHVEAHVYDRATGLPLSDVTVSIVVINRTTGERIDVTPTLMQDLNIGALDIHYGNNVAIVGDSDLNVAVTVNGEEATVDGHLD